MKSDSKRGLVKLRLQTRRILSRGGLVNLERWVPCPTQGTATLEQCERCEHLDRICRDANGHEVGVSCRPVGADSEPTTLIWSGLVRRALSVVPGRTPISTLISPELICVTPDVGLEAIAALFLDEGIGAVPVVDYERFPLGLFSKTDLARHRLDSRRGRAKPATVMDLMTPIVDTVGEHDTLASAADLMVERSAHHLVVIDDAGHAVGMLSSFDFVRFVAALSEPAETEPF